MLFPNLQKHRKKFLGEDSVNLFLYLATPWAMEPIGGNVFNHTVTKLKPESVYYFKMQAETSIGGGAWSDIRAVRTGCNCYLL